MKSARKIQYRVIAIIFLSLYSLFGVSQNIAINGTGSASTRPSAILDLSDNSNLGLLLPNVNIPDATVASPVTSPATGLLVWNTNSSIANGFGVGLYYWNGTQWIYININGTSATVNSIAVTAPVVNTGTSLNPVIGLATPLAILYGGVALSSTPSNGQLLIGNGTNYTLSALTAGTGINITNGSGTITIANAGVNSLTANPPIYITGGSVVNVQGTSTDNGGILYSTGAGTSAAFMGTSGALTGQFLYSNIANAPAFSTSTYPTGVIAINSILYASSANNVSALAPGTNGQILYSNSGVPTWAAPSALNLITGPGVTNYIARWSNATLNLRTGVTQDNGSGVGVSTGAITPQNTLDVNGSTAIGTYAGNNAAPSGASLIISGPTGIGNNAPNASAILDLTNSNTTSKAGFLPPAVASPAAITSPATGLIVYNTTTNCLQEYFGSTGGWENLVCECSGLGTGGAPATPGGIAGPATSCSGASNVAYTIQSVVGATSYTWTVPGFATLVTGNGTAAITVTYTATGTGNITVTATNPCGTSAASTLAVTALAVPGTPGTPSGAAQICQSGGTQTYTTTGATNATSYLWLVSPSGPTLSGIGTSVTLDPSAATAGNYTLTVYGVNGCGTGTVSAGFTIKIIQLTATISSSTNVACNGNSTGSATASVGGNGTAPYTYTWSNGASTSIATGLSAGSYTVTITDANSCSASATVTLTQPASALAVNASVTTNVSCNSGTNGAVQSAPSGGTNPYTYAWQGGATTSSISGKAAGTYTITVTDAHGCTSTGQATITQPVVLAANVTLGGNATSCNPSNGYANSTPSGGTSPYTYLWTPTGGTNSTATALGGGTYTCTVTDASGCTNSASVVVGGTTIVITISGSTNVNCFGNATGSITANPATGGLAPYTYAWTPSGGTNLTASTLTAGVGGTTYTITATDANGCSGFALTTITEPSSALVPPPITSFTNVACFGGATGSITATAATGGTGPYTYAWTPSGGTSLNPASLTAINAGTTYTITATDAHGCTATSTVTLTQPAATLAITIPGGTNCGSVTANAPTGGTPTYAYNWTPSGGTNLASTTGLSTATYTITVTDNHGCTATASAAVSALPAAPATAGCTTSGTCIGTSYTYTCSAVGGATSYTFTFPAGVSTTNPVSSATPTVTATFSCLPTTLTGTVVASNGTCTSAQKTFPIPTGGCAAVSDVYNGPTPYTGSGGSFQTWVVPCGITTITIVAAGASGQPSGNSTPGAGAIVTQTVTVVPGQTLDIVCGGAGQVQYNDYSGGGGGGSFVWSTSNSTYPLVAAGGGGGGGYNTAGTNSGMPGSTTLTPTAPTSGGAGGSGGLGGGGGTNTKNGPGGGGAGWIGNGVAAAGATTTGGQGGIDEAGGFTGGATNTGHAFSWGGYGGGGGGGYNGTSTWGAGGGGGGYNGGGGGTSATNAIQYGGGGGGSGYYNGPYPYTTGANFVSPTNVTQTNSGTNTTWSNGYVNITY